MAVSRWIVGFATIGIGAQILPLSLQARGPTVESCAGHLPAGFRYVFEVDGIVDTTEQAPSFQGSLNIKASDAAGVDEERIGRFIGCVEGLLK